MQFIINASNAADMRAQMLGFLGLDETGATPVPATPATPTVGRPIPAGAPVGAHWVAMPGAPMLQGLDGKPIAVEWAGGVPRLAAAQ